MNVKGTINLVNASIRHNVSNFVFVSTDKAVSPQMLWVLPKRISEQIFKIFHKIKNINFTIVSLAM